MFTTEPEDSVEGRDTGALSNIAAVGGDPLWSPVGSAPRGTSAGINGGDPGLVLNRPFASAAKPGRQKAVGLQHPYPATNPCIASLLHDSARRSRG